MKKNYLLTILIGLTVLGISCSKSTDTVTPVQLVKELTVSLAAANENPQPAGRNETGTASIKIFDDNSITVDATVTGLSSSDNLTLSHIHIGDAVTNGPVTLDFNPVFSGSTLKATITGVRSTLLDTLKAGLVNLYMNVHSTQVAGGLLRGQLFNAVTFAASVTLAGTNEVPSVTTTATGVALLRITADNKLYSKVTVSNLEAGDALTFSHIHSAAAGVNGPVILDLCSSVADFGVAKVSTPSAALLTSIKTDVLYVNAHSTSKASGIVRGQIR